MKYLALGDSYTIGEGVEEQHRWPNMLVRFLREYHLPFEEPDIIAATGWTTADLLDAITVDDPEPFYDLVTLLIGVNNQYQGLKIEDFLQELVELVETAVELCNQDHNKVFLINIPDYSVTPFAASKSPVTLQQQLLQYNKLISEVAERYQITLFDVWEISQRASKDLTLLTDDQLHPSEKQYKLWVNSFQEELTLQLKTKA